jgi:tRNA1Val (adenine37-N6)-methyltransferase
VELKAGSFDVVTANPPYQERGKSLSPERAGHLAAREEIFCTLLDVLKTAAALLRFGGSFFMVFRPERLVDVFEQMRSQKIEPKRIRMVHPRMGKEPAMVLIEGRKGGARQLRVEAPLFIYDGEGAYTKEMRLIYGREE